MNPANIEYRLSKTLTEKDNNPITRMIDELIDRGWKATNGDHSIQQRVIDEGLNKLKDDILAKLPYVYPLPRVSISFSRPIIKLTKVEEEVHVDQHNYTYTCIINGVSEIYQLLTYNEQQGGTCLAEIKTGALIMLPPDNRTPVWQMFPVSVAVPS